MALVNFKNLLRKAESKGIACGAFNVGNMEMVQGVIRAAEETQTPVIMQIAEGRLKYSPLRLMAPMMVEAAAKSSVDIAVHLDHGKSKEVIMEVLSYGFTSVMFDGSALPFKENIKRTAEIIKIASQYGASVEGEIGVVGGNEGDGEHSKIYTDSKEAVIFTRKTGVDAVAISIGNVHGLYQREPELSFDTLEDIKSRIDVPLVLHGGTGISDSDFQRLIAKGIRKINIATANLNALTMGAQEYLAITRNPDYFGLNEAMVNGVYENVKKHINVFNMCEL